MKAFRLLALLPLPIAVTASEFAIARATDSDTSAALVHAEDLNTTYEAVLNEVKKEGMSVDSASKDVGIKTATTVSGHYHQTGEHLEIQFIQDNPNETTVHVVAVKQTRYKALNTEPWSSPKIDPKQSQEAAEKLKVGLGW